MKKHRIHGFFSWILFCLVCFLLVGCAEQTVTESVTLTETQIPAPGAIRIAVLSGTTGYGMSKLMYESSFDETSPYSFSVESSPKVIQDGLISGDFDIAALPTNKAAMIYNQTGGAIRMIAVNTLGVMHLVTNNGEVISAIDQLRGKTVCIPEEPSYILRSLCEAAGLLDDMTIETYATPKDLLAAVIQGKVAYAVLPEPLLSTALSKKPTLTVSLDLTQAWTEAYPDCTLMQGCLVARTEWISSHNAALQTFLEQYSASIAYINARPSEASVWIESYFGTTAAVAEQAIPNCNLVCILGVEMAHRMNPLYLILENVPSSGIGTNVPDDAFYYRTFGGKIYE